MGTDTDGRQIGADDAGRPETADDVRKDGTFGGEGSETENDAPQDAAGVPQRPESGISRTEPTSGEGRWERFRRWWSGCILGRMFSPSEASRPTSGRTAPPTSWKDVLRCIGTLIARAITFVLMVFCLDWWLIEHEKVSTPLVLTISIVLFAIAFGRRFRLLLTIGSILAFNIWLIVRGIEFLATPGGTSALSKETAFLIAVTIIAWLIISGYALSLIKHHDQEKEKDEL